MVKVYSDVEKECTTSTFRVSVKNPPERQSFTPKVEKVHSFQKSKKTFTKWKRPPPPLKKDHHLNNQFCENLHFLLVVLRIIHSAMKFIVVAD